MPRTPVQSSPPVWGGAVSLPKLLDDNEDENENEPLWWVKVLARAVPL